MRFHFFSMTLLLFMLPACGDWNDIFKTQNDPVTFVTPFALSNGCEGPVHEGQLGSSTLVPSSDMDRVYAVNRDAGTISVMDRHSGSIQEIHVGLEPTRITRSRDHVYVSLRGERKVLALKETGDSLEIMDVIQTGSEPFGVLSSPDGEKIYATISMENKVVEINTNTHEITASWSVPNEPRWMAIHPNGSTLFVAVARGDLMYRINLAETTKVHELPLPQVMDDEFLEIFFGITEEEFKQHAESGELLGLPDSGFLTTARATGDLTLSPDGRSLFIPMLFVDNTTPFPKGLNMDEFHETEEFHEPDVFNVSSGYAQSTRLMPGIGEIPLVEDEEGNILQSDEPQRFYRQDEVFDGGNEEHDGGLNTITGGLSMMEAVDFSPAKVLTSFPTSVLVSRNCDYLTATMEGQNVVTVMRRANICHTADICGLMTGIVQEAIKINTPPTTILESPDGPGGQLLIGEDLYIHALFDRSLSQANLVPVQENLSRAKQCPENNWQNQEPYQDIAVDPFRDTNFPMCSYERFTSQNHVALTAFKLPPEIEEGRRLFFSARDERISTSGSSISCSTCHPGGRTDGLTWQFEDHPRQTPTLAGLISETAPVSWFNDVPTVMDEVILTSQGRMGGQGLTEQEAENVAAFIDWVRPVDNRQSDELSLEAELGRAIFEDQSVGCTKCHSGPQLTDNSIHQVNGVSVRTPKLRGVKATAPFLHDGSAPTLRDVVEMSNSINMGNLTWLSDEDLDYLVAYLESL